jgi:hypothetical protein
MSHHPQQKRTDNRSNHPLAQKPREASHYNLSNLVCIHSMAIIARKRRLVLPEPLLTYPTDHRQLPLLQWQNETRFRETLISTHLGNLM